MSKKWLEDRGRRMLSRSEGGIKGHMGNVGSKGCYFEI
jgi:hypothetical protein